MQNITNNHRSTRTGRLICIFSKGLGYKMSINTQCVTHLSLMYSKQNLIDFHLDIVITFSLCTIHIFSVISFFNCIFININMDYSVATTVLAITFLANPCLDLPGGRISGAWI